METIEQFTARLEAWRAVPHDDQLRIMSGESPLAIDPIIRDAVNDCFYRGGELSVSVYPEGCCSGPTLNECRFGKGEVAGRVTLQNCVDCRKLFLSIHDMTTDPTNRFPRRSSP